MSRRYKALNKPIEDVLFVFPPMWLNSPDDEAAVEFEGKKYKDGDIIEGEIFSINSIPVKMRVQVRIGINDGLKARPFLCKPREGDNDD